MALPHHDAAHGNQTQRPDTELLCAEDRRDYDVTACLQPAIGPQFDAVTQPIECEDLIDLGKAHFPWCPGIFDAGLRRCAGASDMARDQDAVRMCLGDTCSDGANAR